MILISTCQCAPSTSRWKTRRCCCGTIGGPVMYEARRDEEPKINRKGVMGGKLRTVHLSICQPMRCSVFCSIGCLICCSISYSVHCSVRCSVCRSICCYICCPICYAICCPICRSVCVCLPALGLFKNTFLSN